MQKSDSKEPAIRAAGIGKWYPAGKSRVTALQDINLEVARGERFGIIGPDGAGKTSLFRILTTLLLPDSGHASVDGLDVVKDFKRIRLRMGYMPGKFSLYPDLTVGENLDFFASIFNTTVKENYHLIRDIYEQIAPFRDFRASQLSGGMKQKLALSCALIHRPSILFLDEPTTGVDAVSRREFWELLKGLQTEGITILVSTPYMDEASLCNRVAFLQDGRIMQVDTPENIRKGFGRKLWAVKGPDILKTLSRLRNMPEVDNAYPFGEWLHVVLRPGAGIPVWPADWQVRETEPDIEDCFIANMKEHG
jgi:ABC-2 type transport system ATP-binding protein